MLLSLWLPIVLAAVALFFASFLSWMILQLHRTDWGKLVREDEFIMGLAALNVPAGSYMFPAMEDPSKKNDPAFVEKWRTGPCGIITLFSGVNMGRNLGLTFLYFLAVSFGLGYLATLALPKGADFLTVFRFVATAGVLAFLAAIVQHSIWFHNRIIGHVIESIAYAAIVGAIFGAFWPA